MKIQKKIAVPCEAATLWKILMAREDYANWNPYIQKITGQIALDSQIEVAVKVAGKPVQQKKATVTGLVANKYFSFCIISGIGNWWLSEELVFRMVPQDGGGCEFFNEWYGHGFGLRFTRKKISLLVTRKMEEMNNELKAFCKSDATRQK